MLYLIYGGSGSGKSEYAEQCVLKLSDEEKYYIATMKVYGEEGMKKVSRHRKLRMNKGFETIEKQTDVHELNNEYKGGTALLECLSNLVANEMFVDDKIIAVDEVVDKVSDGIKKLGDTFDNLVVVTNNIFEDGIEYDEGTKHYMHALGKINEILTQVAAGVVEVVVGIPVVVKGQFI